MVRTPKHHHSDFHQVVNGKHTAEVMRHGVVVPPGADTEATLKRLQDLQPSLARTENAILTVRPENSQLPTLTRRFDTTDSEITTITLREAAREAAAGTTSRVVEIRAVAGGARLAAGEPTRQITAGGQRAGSRSRRRHHRPSRSRSRSRSRRSRSRARAHRRRCGL